MNLHGIIEQSEVNGPGLRAVIFVQGCTLACPGCQNPESHNFTGGQTVDVEALAERITSIEGIEGITFSGGEPMHQADNLIWLCEEVRRRKRNFSFGMFTGYTERELQGGRFDWCRLDGYIHRASSNNPNIRRHRQWLWRNLRMYLDFAVMGRFNQLEPSSNPMCSSGNQQLKCFSDRYGPQDFPAQGYEIIVKPGGLTQITGFPPTSLVCELQT